MDRIDKVINAMLAKVIEEARKRKREFIEYYIGKRVPVLAEDIEVIDGESYSVGYTPEYVKVAMPVTQSGQISEILCFGQGCDIMLGKVREV